MIFITKAWHSRGQRFDPAYLHQKCWKPLVFNTFFFSSYFSQGILDRLNTAELDKMVLSMREEGLSASSINSYTRTLKVFFSWCNEEGPTDLNIKIFKAPETVTEVYTDEELLILLKKPEANCNFCEYRNWVIINFLLNSGYWVS